jgi:hypothetical protein
MVVSAGGMIVIAEGKVIFYGMPNVGELKNFSEPPNCRSSSMEYRQSISSPGYQTGRTAVFIMTGMKDSLYGEGARSEQERTWFGVAVRVTLGPGFIHHVRVGTLSLPHPPVVNYLLRLGLSGPLKYELSFVHEFAHLQTLPAVIIYALALFAVVYHADAGLTKIVLALFSIQVVWEILAETYTYAGNPRHYRNSYRAVSIIPRLIFWVVACASASACWIVILS